MSEIISTYSNLLQRLKDNPDDEELLDRAANALYANPEGFCKAAETVLPPVSRAPAAVEKGVWENCIGEQKCHPVEIQHPKSRQDLIAAVNKASAKKLPVRAVGSGHSFSDVAVTDGILLEPQRMDHVIALDTSLLKDPSQGAKMVSVESGITIEALNDYLDSQNLALINMGAYDGQTLAGAISTGTHGTGVELGPLSSYVLSMVIVTESGKVLQVEPTNGITDPAKFKEKVSDRELVQDDDSFQSNVVAMGCTGLIYSYTLQVMSSYYLKENRTASTWETVKSNLLTPTGQLSNVVTEPRHFEIDINPYALDGNHECIVTVRNEIIADRPSGTRGIPNWLSGLLASVPWVTSIIVRVFNLWPGLIPRSVSNALKTLEDHGYVDKSYKVLNLGKINEIKAYAVELSFDSTAFVATIDHLLEIYARFAEGQKWYQTGPIGVRFVQAADAYLSPQYGRVTCMAELDMLDGINHGQDLLKAIQAEMLKIPGARVHWGLELDTLRGNQVPGMYPKYPQWLAVYQRLNSTGRFNNPFTDRMGISTKSAE